MNRWASSRGVVMAEVLLFLCVLGVIGLVLTLVMQPGKSLAEGLDQQRKTDLKTIQQALKEYAADHNGYYPVANSQAGYFSCYDCKWPEASTHEAGVAYTADNWIPELVEKNYLPSLPTEPLSISGSECPLSGYIYVSGGVGYKVFSPCDPKTDLNTTASDTTYCGARPPYDASRLDTTPTGAEPLDDLVDPARPGWSYAVYTYELACY